MINWADIFEINKEAFDLFMEEFYGEDWHEIKKTLRKHSGGSWKQKEANTIIIGTDKLWYSRENFREREVCYCDLYKFFDDNQIKVNVFSSKGLFEISISLKGTPYYVPKHGSGGDRLRVKDRYEALDIAFTGAFHALETGDLKIKLRGAKNEHPKKTQQKL